MDLSSSRLSRELVSTATAFHSRQLWKNHDNDDCFALVVPEEDHPMFASIMGHAGEEFGLMLFRGPEAYRNLLAMLAASPGDTDMPDNTAFLGFNMARFARVPPFGRDLLHMAGVVCRRESLVPFFVAKDSGRQPRAVTPDELRKCLYTLKGVLKAHDEGMLRPTSLREGTQILTLTILGDVLIPDISSEYRLYEGTAPSPVVALPNVPGDLPNLPRLPVRWLIGFPTIPVRIQDDDRTVRVVMVVDEASEAILSSVALHGGVPDALQVIYETLRGHGIVKKKGLPREVLVANRELFAALQPVLKALGVGCGYEPSILLLDEMVGDFLGKLAGKLGQAQPSEDVQEAMPAPADLQGWKACDKRLYHRAMSWLPSTGHYPTKAIVRYFGNVDEGETRLYDPDDTFAGPCFFEWLWIDYRADKRGKTLAERMLSEPLPEPERALLRARMEAIPSLYKVQEIRKGESLTLLDVLFGGETVVYDQGLSESAVADMSFPARLFPAGNFHLVSPLGPAVPAWVVDDAIGFLEGRRLELTPEGTRAKVHLFGHLWGWLEQRRRQKLSSPRMANADGETLCFHTATYTLADEAAARKAIAAREDIEPQDDGTGYYWLRHGEGAHGLGDTIHLGTLTFVGEALLVEVNSAGRLAKAREWLDAVPGIAFQAVRTRSLKDMLEADIPLDDRPTPGEKIHMTPELLGHVRAMLRDHYMRWLDMPIPVFGGKTPRQMCQSTEGRKRVTLLIRTMPRSHGPDGADIDVPRDEMLKALGLGPA